MDPGRRTSIDRASEEMSVTTVSDLSALQRYVFCLCATGPRAYRIADFTVNRVVGEPRGITLTATDLVNLRDLRRAQDTSTLNSIVSSLCRTRRLDPDLVSKVLDDAYVDIADMTCGGMARVYVATRASTGTSVAIKVTESGKGFGTFEWKCYDMLRRRKFRIPAMHARVVYGSYILTVMERCEFTFSTLCIYVSRRDGCLDRCPALVAMIEYILGNFADRGITYSDFSPDNIVCRLNAESAVECVLIDPQFAVRTSLLAKSVGAHWARNVDRAHFAYKMKTLEMHSPSVRPISDAFCTALLGYVPSYTETRDFLTQILPASLRCTYDLVVSDTKNYALE